MIGFNLDFDAFVRSFVQNRDTSFAFLLGAGASITSGIPSADDCIWDWKRMIYCSSQSSIPPFIDPKSDLCKISSRNGLIIKEGSRLLEILMNIPSMQKKLYLLRVIE